MSASLRKVGKQILSTLSADAASLLTTMFFSIVITRLLQPTGKGYYATMMSLAMIVARGASFGLSKALIYELNQDDRQRASILGASVLLLPALIALGLSLFTLMRPADVSLPGWLFGCCVITALLVGDAMEGSLRAVRRIYTVNVTTLLYPLVQLGAVLACARWASLSYETVLGAVFAAYLFRAGVCTYFAWRAVGFRVEAPLAAIRRLLGYGFWYQLYAFLWSVHCRLGTLLLKHYATAAAAGIYATGANLAQLIWRLAIGVTFVTGPYLAQARADKDSLRKTALTARVATPMFGLATICGLFLARPVIVAMYGDAFAESARVFRIVLPGTAAIGLNMVLINHLTSRGLVRPLAVFGAAGLALNWGLHSQLIPRLGVIGAAWATTLSFGSTYIAVLLFSALSNRRPIREFTLLSGHDLAMIRRRGRAAPSG